MSANPILLGFEFRTAQTTGHPSLSKSGKRNGVGRSAFVHSKAIHWTSAEEDQQTARQMATFENQSSANATEVSCRAHGFLVSCITWYHWIMHG
jgi:hypothetical protein